MTAGEWRPFEPSRDDVERVFRNAIAAMFDRIDDAQRRRDAQRRFVSLLMHVAVTKIAATFWLGPVRDARLEFNPDGTLLLDYVLDMPIHQISYTHTVIL